MKKMKYLLIMLLTLLISSCYSEVDTWQTCSSLEDEYLEALHKQCGQDMEKQHYNQIKTTSDSNREHYYCKSKYSGFIGTPTIYPSRFDLVNNKVIVTCNELKPFIGKKIEEEVTTLRMQMSLSNTKSCIALNDIFKMELDDKCGDEAEALWNQHKSTWSNEKYYCEEYNGTKVGKDNVFPEIRSFCLAGMEKLDCNKLKTLIGKEIENYLTTTGLSSEDINRHKCNIKGY